MDFLQLCPLPVPCSCPLKQFFPLVAVLQQLYEKEAASSAACPQHPGAPSEHARLAVQEQLKSAIWQLF